MRICSTLEKRKIFNEQIFFCARTQSKLNDLTEKMKLSVKLYFIIILTVSQVFYHLSINAI